MEGQQPSSVTLTGGGTVDYTGGGQPVAVDPNLTVSYSNDPEPIVPALTIKISNGFVSGDKLSVDADGYNVSSTTGTLTIDGAPPGFSNTEAEAIFDSVVYSFNGDAPAEGTDTARTISYSVTNSNGSPSDTSSTVDVANETVCLAAGSLIRTPHGDVAVEKLNVGDLVITASGVIRKVKWLGHRTIACLDHPEPHTCWPIRIAANAFGPNKPEGPLMVSPAHAICVSYIEEFLIPASKLINGSTVIQVETDQVTYWHVELHSHDILIANGLPVESYIDMGNRHFFVESNVVSLNAMLPVPRHTHADFCRPFVEAGNIVDLVRAYLAGRAEKLGWTVSNDANLYLFVDGDRLEPKCDNGAALFHFSALAKEVCLCSSFFVPSHNGSTDVRQLGVCLLSLRFSNQSGYALQVGLDDPRLDKDCHRLEREEGHCWRWTNGNLRLDPSFWESLRGEVSLHVSYDAGGLRQWLAPKESEAGIGQKELPGQSEVDAAARKNLSFG